MTNVEPFYFGDSDHAQYACYQASYRQAPVQSAVVLCYPFGHEYIRAHRSFRWLANRLAQSGHSTFRFDFTGCGDSWGSLEDASVQCWEENVVTAIEAAMMRAAVDRVCVLGARLGGALAAQAVARCRPVAEIVLWDPVINGADYLADLEVEHARMLAGAHVVSNQAPTNPDSVERLGQLVPRRLLANIGGIDLLKLAGPACERALVIDSRGSPAVELLRRHLESMNRATELQRTSERQPWPLIDDVAQVILPASTLNGILTWIGSGRP